MSFLPALNEAYYRYFQSIFSELQFEPYETLSQGPGAIMSFKNELLKLQLVNEMGLLSLNISAAHGKEYFDADLVNALLQLKKIENLKIGQFTKRQLIRNRLDLEEQAIFLRENWSKISKLFNPQNFDATREQLQRLG